MYKGPHLADYCTRCSTSAAMASCSVDINIVDYICMYIIILYCCNLCRKRQLKF